MFRNFLETKNRYTFQTLGLVGPLGVCLGAEWRIFGALIVECTLRGFSFFMRGFRFGLSLLLPLQTIVS